MDLVEKLKYQHKLYCFTYQENCETAKLLKAAADTIEKLITADVRENDKGEWIEDRTEIVCSKCHARYSDEIIFMNRNMEGEPLKYCPNCGADMRGEEDGSE